MELHKGVIMKGDPWSGRRNPNKVLLKNDAPIALQVTPLRGKDLPQVMTLLPRVREVKGVNFTKGGEDLPHHLQVLLLLIPWKLTLMR